MSDPETGPVAREIAERLEAALAPARLAVINDSEKHRGHGGYDGSGESHFTVEVEAEAFRGMSRLGPLGEARETWKINDPPRAAAMSGEWRWRKRNSYGRSPT